LKDYDLIEQEDTIKIDNIRAKMKVKHVPACIIKIDGTKKQIQLKNTLNEEEIKIIMAGGRLNM